MAGKGEVTPEKMEGVFQPTGSDQKGCGTSGGDTRQFDQDRSWARQNHGARKSSKENPWMHHRRRIEKVEKCRSSFEDKKGEKGAPSNGAAKKRSRKGADKLTRGKLSAHAGSNNEGGKNTVGEGGKTILQNRNEEGRGGTQSGSRRGGEA